jgi:hypothetical protein
VDVAPLEGGSKVFLDFVEVGLDASCWKQAEQLLALVLELLAGQWEITLMVFLRIFEPVLLNL